MNKVYVLGAVTGGADNAKELFGVYKKQLGCFDEFNEGGSFEENIYGTPLETMKFKGTDEERFARAKKAVSNAHLIVADASTVSFGAGIELGIAHMLKKRIVVFAQKGLKVSALIKGMIGENNVIYYTDKNDLARKIRDNQTINDAAAEIRY